MTLRAAWPTMGSMASVVIPRGSEDPAAGRAHPELAEVRAWFDEVVAVLSPFDEDSDLCRWRGGAVPLEECSPLLASVVGDVLALQRVTDGGFHPYDRSGRFDPTGYVKGWAVERAVWILASAGVRDACLGIGGDIQTIGVAERGRPWRVAVADPANGERVLALVHGGHPSAPLAVATSGDAQRGDHIWAGLGGTPGHIQGSPRALACVTVVGPQLRLADAFATAIWAHARVRPLAQAWSWLAGTGYEALAVERSGRRHGTPGMDQHLVRGAA
jgi:thiamine biosynthesis lipoprotein